MLKIILAGSNHIQIPNLPRNSQHQFVSRKKYPFTYYPERVLQKTWQPLLGVSLFSHYGKAGDLIHSFNAIPHTKKPWVVTFESVLPRTLGSYGSKISSLIIDRLTQENCRQIIAMSDYAKRRFLAQNEDWAHLKSVRDKVKVIHPNFPIKSSTPKSYRSGEPLQIIFVGNEFARKGGIVALRIARKAHNKKLPLKVKLISKMTCGGNVYTDCRDASKYRQDLQLLDLPNVELFQNISNQKVIELLKESHFQVMCTLEDTYGFSILEGFSVGTPVITTNVCALPEFVRHNENGYMVDLKLDRHGRWEGLAAKDVDLKLDRHGCWEGLAAKDSDRYWELLDRTYEDLAERTLEIIEQIIDNPSAYQPLSQGAIEQAKIHDSEAANRLFDRLYMELC